MMAKRKTRVKEGLGGPKTSGRGFAGVSNRTMIYAHVNTLDTNTPSCHVWSRIVGAPFNCLDEGESVGIILEGSLIIQYSTVSF